jgi:hypothetical protein
MHVELSPIGLGESRERRLVTRSHTCCQVHGVIRIRGANTWPLTLAPDRGGDVSHQLELALLLIVADPIALYGRSEPALRAQR